MKTEIAAMQELCHQHICKLYQVIETVDRFYMVLEVSLASLPLPGMMRRCVNESRAVSYTHLTLPTMAVV